MAQFKQTLDRMREQGEADYKSGKPITAYYDVKRPRNSERFRAAYEIGWRGAKKAESSKT